VELGGHANLWDPIDELVATDLLVLRERRSERGVRGFIGANEMTTTGSTYHSRADHD
jgi:hypothetical protein